MIGFSCGKGQQYSSEKLLLTFIGNFPFVRQACSSLYKIQKSFYWSGSGTHLGSYIGSTTNFIKSLVILGISYFMYVLGIPKYGFVFTSISQTLKSSSIKKSNPNSSNVPYLLLGLRFLLTDRNVSIMMSCIRGMKCFSI